MLWLGGMERCVVKMVGFCERKAKKWFSFCGAMVYNKQKGDCDGTKTEIYCVAFY